MTTENNLRQADNEVVVEGILQEVKLEVRKSAAGKDFIGGEITIEQAEGSVHTFRLFSMKLKNDGSENGIFKGLETVKNEYLSIAKVGREEADKVRITSGTLGINDYLGGDGMIKSYPELATNFINRVQAGDKFEPKAEFDVELYVHSISPEMDKDGEETGRVKVKGFVPQFGGGIAPLEFVGGEDVAEFITDSFSTGDTIRVYGDIINRVEITTTSNEGKGFGKAKEKVTRKTVREFLITGGDEEPYDEDNTKAYSKEVIKKALAEREVMLEELKNKKKEDKPKKDEKKKAGFGKPKKDPVADVVDISDDDLPF